MGQNGCKFRNGGPMIALQSGSNSALNSAIMSVMSGDFMDGKTQYYMGVSIEIATGVAMGIAALVIAFNYLKNSVTSFADGKEGSLADPLFIGKILLLLFAINFYGAAMPTILNYFNAIAGTYESSEQAYNEGLGNLVKMHESGDLSPAKVKSKTEEYWKNCTDCDREEKEIMLRQIEEHSWDPSQKTEPLEAPEEGGIFSALSNIETLLFNPSILVTGMIHALLNLVVFLIRFIVKFFAAIVLKVMIVIGPLSIAFSLIPGLNGQLMKWFSTTIGIMMTFVVFNILDALLLDSMSTIMGTMGSMISDVQANNPYSTAMTFDSSYQSVMIIGFDLVVISLYISAFWIASKIIGASDAGGIVGKGIQVGTVLAAAGASAVMQTVSTGASAAGAAAGGGAPGGSTPAVPVSGGGGGSVVKEGFSAIRPETGNQE